jgi:glycosyltransferase involved in cell wall biosynthesis
MQEKTAPPRMVRESPARKYKVLFLGPGPVPPSLEPFKNLHYHISEFCEGDYVTTHWGSPAEYRGRSLTEVYDSLGSFRYHAILTQSVPRLLRFPWLLAYLLGKALRLSRENGPYDAIVAYGPFTFAAVGWLLRKSTGAKLVVEVPGPPLGAHAFESGLNNKIKARLARLYIPRLVRSADALRLYYPSQLDELPPDDYPPAYVFPDLVAVSHIGELTSGKPSSDDRYVLFIGHPFERKGVDVLIKAFRTISDRFSDVRLKIVGYCPDLTPYRELAGENSRIEFLPGLPHDRVLEIMAGCTLFVLPSRAEGVPRVLIEAMAANKPVLSTPVNGTPYLVQDGVHGLLVEPEDVEGLASKMALLLSDPIFAARISEAGHRRVFAEFSEQCYKDGFRNMMQFLAPRPQGNGTPSTSASETEAPRST